MWEFGASTMNDNTSTRVGDLNRYVVECPVDIINNKINEDDMVDYNRGGHVVLYSL